jgi:predicted Fe-S protein YdhL (DUF1289 family)
MVLKVKTPCIGVCSTGIGDSVCRGCKRFSHEVVNWNAYTEAQRLSVSLRLDALLRQVLEARVEIFDSGRLYQQLIHQRLRFHPEQSVYSWLFEVIKVGSGQIRNLEDFGASLLPGYADKSLSEFKKMVDDDFYVLSCIHYERYFAKV